MTLQPPATLASDAERERAVEALREARSEGRLTLEEFTDRVTEAYGARTHGDLEQLTRDLPPVPVATRRRRSRLVGAAFGHTVRRGRWRLGRRLVAVSVFGDIDLDLREATLEREDATIVVVAFFGNADVYVPEGIDADASGITVFGHARDWGRDEPRPGAPSVRVRVVSLFGTADLWRVPGHVGGSFREMIDAVRGRALPPGRMPE